MKKLFRSVCVLHLCAVLILLSACGKAPAAQDSVAPERTAPLAPTAVPEFKRDISYSDYSGITAAPLELKNMPDSIALPRNEKAYTIMVYMNGSDLESENAAATADINEMIAAQINSDNVNIIIFTGGAHRWHKSEIPSGTCAIWSLENGRLIRLADAGTANMGDPGTLSGFITYTLRNFPAKRQGIILWDHGGGSIAGYGYDEINDDSATLLKLDYAFLISGLKENKLEFIGFDACLMATVEMAVVASGYASYLIASEDLEPSDGWDYGFLSELNTNPQMDGAELGSAIADFYLDYYGPDSLESLTLSVADLRNAGQVMAAVGNLTDKCEALLSDERGEPFLKLAERRGRTRTFGQGSARDNDCDMVDIGDMAYMFSDLYPREARAVIDALDRCVVYNRSNSDIWLGGLSVYFIYGSSYDAENTLKIYSSLKMSSQFTDFLFTFSELMNAPEKLGSRSLPGSSSVNIDTAEVYLTRWLPVPNGGGYYLAGMQETKSEAYLWPHINDIPICMERIEKRGDIEKYAVPACVNGSDADIIVLKQETGSTLLGFQRREGYIVQKGLEPLSENDIVQIYYRTKDSDKSSNTNGWIKGKSFNGGSDLQLLWSKADSGRYALLYRDVRRNERFSAFL